MNFAEVAKIDSTIKETENGAKAFSTTSSKLLNLFATIGALRNRDDVDIEKAFAEAFAEDKLLATKLSFYARNVRGGLGEKKTPRVIWHKMAQTCPEIMSKNIPNIPKFGRFDDLYCFVGTPVEEKMWDFIAWQLGVDKKNMAEGKPISLLAKWLKSTNTSSQESCILGRKTAKALDLTEKQYRKMLSSMRKYLKVVENQMSQNEWEKINFAAVPSYAMKNYRKAFLKHTPDQFVKFMERVEKGEEQIKASTLYPYDLVGQYTKKMSFWSNRCDIDPVVEAQWKALPNYVNGENNILVMADVSGSMSGRPMDTSVGLAIYFAERNKGYYKDLYMTFTDQPRFVTLNSNDSLEEKVSKVMSTDVGYSTNLKAAFNRVLKTGIDNKISQEDMPKALVVISDMEIDQYTRSSNASYWGFINEMELKFNQVGYELPKIILWNVDARQDTFLTSNHPKVNFVSGQSVSTFKTVLDTIELSAYDAMVKTLSDKMYDCIEI